MCIPIRASMKAIGQQNKEMYETFVKMTPYLQEFAETGHLKSATEISIPGIDKDVATMFGRNSSAYSTAFSNFNTLRSNESK